MTRSAWGEGEITSRELPGKGREWGLSGEGRVSGTEGHRCSQPGACLPGPPQPDFLRSQVSHLAFFSSIPCLPASICFLLCDPLPHFAA